MCVLVPILTKMAQVKLNRSEKKPKIHELGEGTGTDAEGELIGTRGI